MSNGPIDFPPIDQQHSENMVDTSFDKTGDQRPEFVPAAKPVIEYVQPSGEAMDSNEQPSGGEFVEAEYQPAEVRPTGEALPAEGR